MLGAEQDVRSCRVIVLSASARGDPACNISQWRISGMCRTPGRLHWLDPAVIDSSICVTSAVHELRAEPRPADTKYQQRKTSQHSSPLLFLLFPEYLGHTRCLPSHNNNNAPWWAVVNKGQQPFINRHQNEKSPAVPLDLPLVLTYPRQPRIPAAGNLSTLTPPWPFVLTSSHISGGEDSH